MKRLLVTILSILYLATTVGATVRVHYCKDKLAGVSLVVNDGNCHTCGKKSAKKSCCRNEYHIVKNSSSHILPQLVAGYTVVWTGILPPVLFLPYPPHIVPVAAKLSFTAASPPSRQSNPIYISVCSFRI